MMNKVLLTVFISWLSTGFVSAATDKVVCYHGSWSKYRSGNGQFTVSNIDPTLCTHLIYTFVGINTEGSVVLLDEYLDVTLGNFASFNALKQKNSNLKTLLAVGGWNEGSTKYSTMAASSTLRANFDGFDLDWEYPAQRGGASSDVENFATLVKEFREVFDQHGLLLTAAVAAAASSVDLSYDVPSLSQYLDWINVMTYDFKGLMTDAAITGWIERGADPQKLVLGLGIYGRSFTLSDSSNTALGAPSSGAGNSGSYTLEAGMLGYLEICELQLAGGWTTVWDDEQKVPYTYKGNQWVGYDNAESIAKKAKYAQSLNLGGVMIWSYGNRGLQWNLWNQISLLTAIQNVLGSTTNSSVDSSATEEESNDATARYCLFK
ncbi:hypothetical protein NQ317_006815 [Molorchus minor]|uniref:GH18 domain-containing protein n=1 Tax=Molorchus minor TaxID=1323400 RepID=A0ABQ9IUS6_9CUCU|nr:hypothetical protein NQ317_006815 [Molorchus minor]